MSKTIIGWGYEARSGKDAVCSYLATMFPDVLHTSFAKALRAEVHSAVRKIQAEHFCPSRDAMHMLCYREGVKYDPFAPADRIDIYGKQRSLLQHWGMKRRDEDPDYWVKRVATEVERAQCAAVVISDLRFVNEAEWIRSTGGSVVHVMRPCNDSGLEAANSGHISERSLRGFKFDYTILNDGSLELLHQRARDMFIKILATHKR